MHFVDQMTVPGLAIIIDNVEAIEDQSNSHKDVQDLIKELKEICFIVLNFNSLSPKPLLHLLKGVNEVAATNPLNAFVLIILSKGKTPEIYCNNNGTLQTTDILSCFSNVECPKLFFFQTILTEGENSPTITNESCSLSNFVFFFAYPSQNKSSQVSIFIECIQALSNNTVSDIVDEIIKKTERNHYPIYYQKGQDLQNSMILSIQSPNNK